MAVLRILLLLPVLMTYAQGPCCSLNVTVVAGEGKSALPGGSVEYTTSIVDSEYIVMFTSYYTSNARDGFISAALRPFHDWAILPRSNPSSDYPSDFSVVTLSATHHQALEALTQHPAIKQVTPQKKLTRILNSGQGIEKASLAYFGWVVEVILWFTTSCLCFYDIFIVCRSFWVPSRPGL